MPRLSSISTTSDNTRSPSTCSPRSYIRASSTPTVSHAFISLLARKGFLQMLFTQNIDCLERRAGVPADQIVEAHGSFATQRCIECKTQFPDHDMKDHVFRGEVPKCTEAGCSGTVKPDIVFFGESLPAAFSHNSFHTSMADLVLIIGTSLSVYPFAGLPEMARHDTPRVLFNMERVGHMGCRADDVCHLGSIDNGIRELADELGWRDELEQLWREVVGEEEAERQLRSQKKHDEEVEEEVQKLTEGIEATLNLSDDDDDLPTGGEASKERQVETQTQLKPADEKKSASSQQERPEITETKATTDTKPDDDAIALGPTKEPDEPQDAIKDKHTFP